LIRDINPSGSGIFCYTAVVLYNGKIYFVRTDGSSGNEVWSNDGAGSGTHLVKEVNPGSAEGISSGFIAYNQLLYFSIEDGTNVQEHWVTDGTAINAQMEQL
jgi:ELWxxDGT repeat protein